jgi:hypothetical protein
MCPAQFFRVLASYLAEVSKAPMFRPRALLALLALWFSGPLAVFWASCAGRATAAASKLGPASFEALGQRPALHTDFTFDRSMLRPARRWNQIRLRSQKGFAFRIARHLPQNRFGWWMSN